MTQSNDFMLLFRFEASNNYQPTAAEEAEMHQQWGNFIGNITLQEKLVSTHQLGFEGKQVLPDSTVSEGVCILDNQMIGGNMVVRANGIEEAVEMAKQCPILFIGGSVEVRNILPM